MTTSMDDKTEDAFSALGLISEATEAEWAAERAATEEMVAQLEAKYVNRGLKFTQIFAGAIPVQAYGHIDGERFYFRFRGNWGQLKVGPYDREIEEKTYLRRKEFDDKRIREADIKLAAGEISKMDYGWLTIGTSDRVFVSESDPQFYPTRITKHAALEGKDPEDFYNGSLNNDEAFEMFSTLADTLQDIPEKDQVDKITRIYLEGGPDAVTEYHKKREPAIRAKIIARSAARAAARAAKKEN